MRNKPENCRRRGITRLALVWLIGCLTAGGYLIARPNPSSPADATSPTVAGEVPRYVSKNIEDIQVGDYVLAKDPMDSSPAALHKVVGLPRNWTEHIVHMRIGGGGEIGATRSHPFWAEGKGWTAAKDLAVGDSLVDENERPVVIEKTWTEDRTTGTFNLTVEGVHTYYVLAGDVPVLVHNLIVATPGGSAIPTQTIS